MNVLHRSFLTAFTLLFVLAMNASAQQQSTFSLNQLDLNAFEEPALDNNDEDFPRVNEYKTMPLMAWDTNWWASLEQEISLEDESYRSLSGQSIQNAIFFLANHGDRINMTPSAPVLLDVYLYNKSEAMRIMALAALIHIGDQETLETAEQMLYRQQSERVQKFSIAALTDYKTQQFSKELAMNNK